MYEPTLLNQLDNGKDFKGIAFGIQPNKNLENNNSKSINELNIKNDNEIKNIEHKNNNHFNYDQNKNQIIQKLNFKQLINHNENIHKKLNRSMEKNYNNPINSYINYNDNIIDNLNINNNTIINKKSKLQQFTQKKDNLNNKEIKLNNEINNNKKNKKIIENQMNQKNKITKIQSKNKNIIFNKKLNLSVNVNEHSPHDNDNNSISNINKIELGIDYFPNKEKSIYNPNNNPYNGKIFEKNEQPNENLELKEIVLRFKLTEEEYKLLLREKAKLINPIENQYNKKLKYHY